MRYISDWYYVRSITFFASSSKKPVVSDNYRRFNNRFDNNQAYFHRIFRRVKINKSQSGFLDYRAILMMLRLDDQSLKQPQENQKNLEASFLKELLFLIADAVN